MEAAQISNLKIQNDKEIILKIKKGEIDNFAYIVKRYTKPIHGFIAKKMYRKDDVDDIVQQTFLKLYTAIDRLDERRPVLPYLYQIAKNELKMYFRSFKYTVSLDERIKVHDEKQIYGGELDEAERLLALLPHDQRNVLLLLSEGYSYQQIADKFKKSINTIKTMVRRARIKMMKLKYEKS